MAVIFCLTKNKKTPAGPQPKSAMVVLGNMWSSDRCGSSKFLQ